MVVAPRAWLILLGPPLNHFVGPLKSMISMFTEVQMSIRHQRGADPCQPGYARSGP
jgi:hypothetical protein